MGDEVFKLLLTGWSSTLFEFQNLNVFLIEYLLKHLVNWSSSI